jgi:hypothetical protein
MEVDDDIQQKSFYTFDYTTILFIQIKKKRGLAREVKIREIHHRKW